jgi:acid phosphatase family membrane protein YuiD
VTGFVKLMVNSWREKRLAMDLMGYGGMPSNHSSIMSTITTLIGLKEGFSHPAFGIALATAMIVIFDASSLRRQVGFHAEALNSLRGNRTLRERIGHLRTEIAAGIFLGMLIAYSLNEFVGDAG